jgi:hypothetical protein
MKKQLMLTGKEIEDLYKFYQLNLYKGGVAKRCNIIIQQNTNSIGDITYIQTQEDFWKRKDNWEDITDYESW